MFALGYSKYAPGSVASFVTCLIFICFYNFQINVLFLILGVILLFLFSVYSIDTLENSFSETDAKEIVIDEFIGQSIPVLTIYNFLDNKDIGVFILYTSVAFILFRLFDIWKPYPINKIDKNMKNGFGVILDDIVAGLYSVIILLMFIIFVDYV